MQFQNKFAVEYGEAMFLRINQWCIKHHAKLLVITTGFNAFYPPRFRDPTKVFLAAAPAFFEKNHIAFYDSAVSFKKLTRGKKFQIPRDQHPNALGAKLISEACWPWIKQKIKN
ncbi:MAG: hypothetical protein NTZ67_08565 [Gammaproteobacteria bacterium]|nr:hypothetical protein [Gammaproteobacteria bacterium]